MTELLDLPARWVTLRERTPEDLPAVTLVDDAVAQQAPWSGWGLQVALGVQLELPDAQGQPGLTEQPALRAFEQAYVDALDGHARLVATVTLDGIRELVAYAKDVAWLERWQDELPDGLDGYDWEMHVLEDPRWTALRELAGRLEPGEQVVRPFDEDDDDEDDEDEEDDEEEDEEEDEDEDLADDEDEDDEEYEFEPRPTTG